MCMAQTRNRAFRSTVCEFSGQAIKACAEPCFCEDGGIFALRCPVGETGANLGRLIGRPADPPGISRT